MQPIGVPFVYEARPGLACASIHLALPCLEHRGRKGLPRVDLRLRSVAGADPIDQPNPTSSLAG